MAQQPLPQPTKPKRFQAVAIVQVGPLWTCRTITIEGDRVVNATDDEHDTRTASAGKAIRRLAR